MLAVTALGLGLTLASCKKEAIKTGSSITVNPTNIAMTTPPFPTKSEALVAMQVYNNHFYNQYGTYGPSYKAYYWKDDNHTSRMDFWTQQEAIEMLIDAYNINPSTDFLNKIQYLYNGVRDGYGLLWSSNIYNDDVTWGALMCIRAYHLTNDGGQLTMAENNFNMMWNRAWDTTALGGGLWWNTNNNTKNIYTFNLLWTSPPIPTPSPDTGWGGFKHAIFCFNIGAIPANPEKVNSWQRQDEWHGDRVPPGMDWNRTIAAGATANVGFVGAYQGPNVQPPVFTLNGKLCTTR